MEKIQMTCIICPNGCQMTVEAEDGEVMDVEGNRCMRGYIYAQKEITDPTRTVTTTLEVEGGILPRVSVKTAGEIPKEKIMDCMEQIKNLKVQAPVRIGDILLTNVADTGTNLVATVNVPKK
ncbi:DUF1667 domain-containing protein [Lachnospiraceae bacterium KGMB03038]|nr:DUF1667 domain-containing protein [Lachnospiraceae bacterium KGMB03038]